MKLKQFQNTSENFRLIRYKVSEKKLGIVFNKLEAAGLRPILIKGWAAARYYDKPWQRNIGDIDLVFRPDIVNEDLKQMLYEITDEPFDIHAGLRKHDSLSFEDVFENSNLADCQGIPVRVLRSEDHLRVLCVHWLFDGGAYKEKLWDIFYLIKNREPSFDWERCLGVVDPMRRRWIEGVITIAHRYLGLETDNLPFETGANRLPGWFVSAIENEWKSGIKLLPLISVKNDQKKMFQQIKKRIPPSPVQAMVESEHNLDGNVRYFNQVSNFYTRFKPYWRKIKG